MKVEEVIVYVEGPSDESAMKELLKPLIEQKQKEGIAIGFFASSNGDKKEAVLTKVPLRAVSILRNRRHSIVVAMPDLYPKNKGFPHETFDELVNGILENFNNALRHKGIGDDIKLKDRFRVFCFKYDLEALILASEEALKSYLETDHLNVTWRIPVEDQDHNKPPKRIVEDLFKGYGKRYIGKEDAPLILGRSDYQYIADKCPQCFKPFVEFLTGLQGNNR